MCKNIEFFSLCFFENLVSSARRTFLIVSRFTLFGVALFHVTNTQHILQKEEFLESLFLCPQFLRFLCKACIAEYVILCNGCYVQKAMKVYV